MIHRNLLVNDGNYAVRPAAPRDAETIVTWFPAHEDAVLWGGYDIPNPLTAAWLQEQYLLTSRRYYVFVDKDDRICGTFSLRQIGVERMHLGRFGIHPGLRGRGLGKQMLNMAIEMARGAGAKVITLVVFAHNTPARRLYQSCGFVPSSVPHDVDEHKMLMEFAL